MKLRIGKATDFLCVKEVRQLAFKCITIVINGTGWGGCAVNFPTLCVVLLD